MKIIYPFLAIILFTSLSFGQEVKPVPEIEKPAPGEKTEPNVKIDVKREYDDDGNITRFDSTYTWSWSDDGDLDNDMLKEFEQKMETFRDNMGDWGDGSFGFNFDDEMLEHMKKFNKDFNFQDSVFFQDQWKDLFNGDPFQFHGLNFDGNNFEIMPFDKEQIEELEKRMKDLYNDDLGERIRKFIEEHKKEIDEVQNQIRKSIPPNKKAI